MEKRAISFLPPIYAVIPFAPRGNRLAFHAPEHEKNSAGGGEVRNWKLSIGNYGEETDGKINFCIISQYTKLGSIISRDILL